KEMETTEDKSNCAWKIVNELNGRNIGMSTLQMPGDPSTLANSFNGFMVDSVEQALDLPNSIDVAGITFKLEKSKKKLTWDSHVEHHLIVEEPVMAQTPSFNILNKGLLVHLLLD
ncbi:hypothetical protein HHI36_011760, partial [Cryptolaemus montrouzieri]